jgi:hypothetical protein
MLPEIYNIDKYPNANTSSNDYSLPHYPQPHATWRVSLYHYDNLNGLNFNPKTSIGQQIN